MDDAVNERSRAGRVGEDSRPVAESQVGRQDEALAFVSTADHLEQEVGVASVVGQVANFVDAQNRTRAVVTKPTVKSTRRLLRTEVEQQLRASLTYARTVSCISCSTALVNSSKCIGTSTVTPATGRPPASPTSRFATGMASLFGEVRSTQKPIDACW
jgi:hypothetical protein